MPHTAELESSMSVANVAALFRRSEKTIYRWHGLGRLAGYRVGRELRFPTKSVEALAAGMATASDASEARQVA